MNNAEREKILEWFRRVGADEKGLLPNSGRLSTGEQVPFLLTHLDVPEKEGLALPGEPPYLRGIYPTMYRGRLWTMRQYAGFGTAEETNRRFRYLLAHGQTGLSVAFDLPTQMGLDPDEPMARGEVGRVGVSIATVDDVVRLFEGIPLDRVSVSMTINATAPILLAMLWVTAEEQGADPRALSGTTQNDILKEYVARGTYIYPPGPSVRLAADLIAFCTENLPKWNPISVSGYHMREAGCDAVQEVAFTLADGLEYVRATKAFGLDVDSFAPRFSFFFGCHNNLFEEVAKFRAARVAWATLMKEKAHAKDPRSLALRFHTQTAGCTLTAQQPWNNVVRVTLQALAAVLGGTQSLHTNAMDEALALPSEETARLALRTQQIIALESHVADFVDPLGGSYVVEYLTDLILKRVLALVEKVEEMGGMAKAIEAGFVQKAIEESAYRYQKAIESGETKVVGVNCLVEGSTTTMERRKDIERMAALEEKRVKAFVSLKSRRIQREVESALAGVREAASRGRGITSAILEAVRARATIGEISKALGTVFGYFWGQR